MKHAFAALLVALFANATLSPARAETEKNGPIVARVSNQLLAPTAFSSVK